QPRDQARADQLILLRSVSVASGIEHLTGARGGSLSCGLSREGTKRHDHAVLGNAEPYPIELVTRARDRDSSVRTATAFLGLTTGNHLDIEGIIFRCTNSRQL